MKILRAKKFHVVAIINGQEQLTPAKGTEVLSAVRNRALKLSGNTGRTQEDFQVRDIHGVLLETNRKMDDFGFSSGTRLFVSLAVGAGGTA